MRGTTFELLDAVHAQADVDDEGRVVMEVFDSPQHRFTLLTFMQLRDRVIQAGLLTNAEADAYVAAYNRPDFLGKDATWMSVCGRKPVG